MAVGENIKKIRNEKKLTQKELARLLNVSEAMISQYESKNSNLRLSTIQKIAAALGVKLEDLIGLETFDTPEDFEKKKKELLDSMNKNSETLTIVHTVSNNEKIISLMNKLNEKGQEKAIEHVEILTKVNEYKI